MSLICLFTYVYRKRRRRLIRNRSQTRAGERGEAYSAATDMSIVCVCGDSFGNRRIVNDGANAGEDTALLSGCSERVAYS